MIREAGPFEGKAQLEIYVEVYECRCQQCDNWEQDPVTEAGICALGEDLSFLQHQGEPLNPKCASFEKQIGAPPYTSKM
jgi:Zn finger protein HypA/HybF involved in hydrogenase expression